MMSSVLELKPLSGRYDLRTRLSLNIQAFLSGFSEHANKLYRIRLHWLKVALFAHNFAVCLNY